MRLASQKSEIPSYNTFLTRSTIRVEVSYTPFSTSLTSLGGPLDVSLAFFIKLMCEDLLFSNTLTNLPLNNERLWKKR